MEYEAAYNQHNIMLILAKSFWSQYHNVELYPPGREPLSSPQKVGFASASSNKANLWPKLYEQMTYPRERVQIDIKDCRDLISFCNIVKHSAKDALLEMWREIVNILKQRRERSNDIQIKSDRAGWL